MQDLRRFRKTKFLCFNFSKIQCYNSSVFGNNIYACKGTQNFENRRGIYNDY